MASAVASELSREGGLGRDIDGWWWVWCADDVGVPVYTGGVGEI